MRMDRETFDALRVLIEAKDSPEWRGVYRERRFPRAEEVKDLDKRYRWDLFYAVYGNSLPFFENTSDDHIDTALRRIVPAL